MSDKDPQATQQQETARVESLQELFCRKLKIPEYQRPYKWSRRNMANLLGDMQNAMQQQTDFHSKEGEEFKYRFGTIIVHHKDGFDNIVDGQQRIISLRLILYYLCNELNDCDYTTLDKLLEGHLNNKITQANLHNNWKFIGNWFASQGIKKLEKEKWRDKFRNLFEVVVITVKSEAEAFQLFDSQNFRGKQLDPHDLLKAYHLREMNGNKFAMQRAVSTWEAVEPIEIKKLFSSYLFPIYNWSRQERTKQFTATEISWFKGVSETSSYPFASRIKKSMPAFQITEPFIAGADFFEMVDYYLSLSKYLQEEIRENENFKAILETDNGNIGFTHARVLFETALLAFYDRFGSLDERAVTKLFLWAFMLRVDLQSLGFSSVNRYAIADSSRGTANSNYTNNLPVFALIKKSRTVNEFLSVCPIRVNEDETGSKWKSLYTMLRDLNGENNGLTD
ncbi:hypothetical protein HMPREF0578_0516 [Mobiluncus mulieris 28-1]|uniref:DUF262 domain-containing protein n=1 Tax=Mobiluncus mulieris TaxID=2052 RepID=UPI0001BE7FB3|nr:DUF262 domain-containing protein [Mobiluncus mulieris]EEZ91478.1 hypothetical protein HMPREF0578_0516 [Mobiluncus mulieris 28-1]